MTVIFTEAWTGTNGDPWDTGRWTLRDDTGTGSSSIQTNRGRLSAGGVAYAQRLALASPAANDDFELLFSFATTTDAEQYVDVYYRIGANITSGFPASGYNLDIKPGASSPYVALSELDGSSNYTEITTDTSPGMLNNTRYWVKIRVVGSDHKVRWWADGGGEPGTWQIEESEASHSSGRWLLSVYNGNSTTTRTTDFDDLTIDDLAGGGITGTAAVTLGAFTSSASGTRSLPNITGTVAVTLGPFVAAASGTRTLPAITGTVARTLGAFTSTASGTVTGPGAISGTVAVTLAAFTSAASGSVSSPNVTGTATPTLGAFTAAGTGRVNTPLPFTETWTGADSTEWSAARWENIRRDEVYGGPTVATQAFIASNRGLMTAVGTAEFASHIAQIATIPLTDFELVISWAWGAVGEQGNGVLYHCNSQLAVPEPYPHECWVFGDYTYDVGSLSNKVGFGYYGSGLDYTELWSEVIDNYNTGRRWVRILVQGTRHRGRWWADGDTEPGTWDWDVTNALYPDPGKIVLTFYTGTTGAPVSATWDDLSITSPSGTAAVTLAPFVASASGTRSLPSVTGTAAVTLGAFTSSASGLVAGPGAIVGSAAVTLGPFVAAAAGTRTIPNITGTTTATLAPFTSSASGTVIAPVTGTVARTLAPFTSTASGTVALPPITGTVAVTLGPFVAAGSQAPFGGVAVGAVVWRDNGDGTIIARDVVLASVGAASTASGEVRQP